VNQFTINNQTYSIRLSDHASLRLKQRNVDLFQTIGTILSLGESRIKEYSNSDKDIFIMDNEHNFSIVINIESNTIYIVTVINKCDCFVKNNTIAVNL
jgi:hypothetical protein